MVKYEEVDKEKVQQSIKLLAPWFSLDSYDEKEFIEQGEELCVEFDLNHSIVRERGGEFLLPSTIILSSELKRNGLEFVLGHELGHWYHNSINPQTFTQNSNSWRGVFYSDFYTFNEALADYSGTILKERGLPFSEKDFETLIGEFTRIQPLVSSCSVGSRTEKATEDRIHTNKLGDLYVRELYWPGNLARLDGEDIIGNRHYLGTFFREVLVPNLPKGYRESLSEILETGLKIF